LFRYLISIVMAGHSRPKNGVASARLCPGHPRLDPQSKQKTWIPGTRPAMTEISARSAKAALPDWQDTIDDGGPVQSGFALPQ
jgi:hypothetical protein